MYTLQRYILMTLDPVHIGTGGYQLGRVDLSIVREPGTNLPKIPGTSLSGAARSYAAMRYEKRRCAGPGQNNLNGGHCGLPTCPICYTFGSIKGSEGGNAGTVSIADAQLLLFPVHSLAGPVWVSTVERLQETGFKVTALDVERGEFATTLPDWSKPLNLGWLLLTPKKGDITVEPADQLQDKTTWKAVAGRLVLVDDSLFSQIVNSNLEVRTSVSIDPLTGAAKSTALFTYEALPRATWLWSDVIEDDYPSGTKPWPVSKKFNGEKDNAGELLGETWVKPLDVVKSGLHLVEHLGVGGMGTRGFGRIKMVGDWEVSHG
jgi:CRISPR-associated protein Cmr4